MHQILLLLYSMFTAFLTDKEPTHHEQQSDAPARHVVAVYLKAQSTVTLSNSRLIGQETEAYLVLERLVMCTSPSTLPLKP